MPSTSQDLYQINGFFQKQLTNVEDKHRLHVANELIEQAHAIVTAIIFNGMDSDVNDSFTLSKNHMMTLLTTVQTQLEMAQEAIQP